MQLKLGIFVICISPVLLTHVTNVRLKESNALDYNFIKYLIDQMSPGSILTAISMYIFLWNETTTTK